MTPDAVVRRRVGEKFPLYAETFAPTDVVDGTIDLEATPTFTLLDADEVVVGALEDVNVSGYDAAAAEAPRAWYLLDTTDPEELAAGTYFGVFTLTGDGSDALERRFKCVVGLILE